MRNFIADWLHRRKERLAARDAAEIAEFIAEVDRILRRTPTLRANDESPPIHCLDQNLPESLGVGDVLAKALMLANDCWDATTRPGSGLALLSRATSTTKSLLCEFGFARNVGWAN